MSDYYDRLGSQLADLTAHGAPRRLRLGVVVPRLRPQMLALAVGVLVVLAVGAVFLSAGSVRRPVGSTKPAAPNGPPVIHNYAPNKAPPLNGQLVCNTDLRAVGGGKSPSGVAFVDTKPPTQFEFSIIASHLSPNARGDVYAVWLLPAVQTASGAYQLISQGRPELVGFIKPVVGRDGKLAAEGVLPRDAGGSYELLITVERNASAKTPGRAVLEGPVSF